MTTPHSFGYRERRQRKALDLTQAAQWRQNLGVDVEVRSAPRSELVARLTGGDFTLFHAMWIPGYPDPDCYLRVCVGLDAPDIGWRNERYEDLVQQARQLTSQSQRMALYRQAEQIVVDEAPILPATYGRLHLLLKPRVRRFRQSPMKQRFWHEVVIERE